MAARAAVGLNQYIAAYGGQVQCIRRFLGESRMGQARAFSPRYISSQIDADQAAAQIAALHATARAGKFICLARRAKDRDLFGQPIWESHYLAVGEATAERLGALLDAEGDWYVAPAALWKAWRNAKAVESTGAVWVDLDWYKSAEHARKSAGAVLAEIGAALDAAGIPRPGLVVSSGRGHQLYWLFDQAVSPWPARAKRDGVADPSRLTAEVRREKMFDALVTALDGFGPDKAPRNRCAVLRLAGTINQKGGRSEIVELTGDRVNFEAFAAAVLKPRRPTRKPAARSGRIASFSAAKAGRDQAAGRLTNATKARAIIDDIEALLTLRYGDGRLPAGRRDLPAFHLAVAWSCLVGAKTLAAVIDESGGWTRGGWDAAEARTNLGAVVRLAQKREAGDASARYRIPVARIIAELEISEAEMRAAGLRILVSGAVRRENAAERKRQSRGSVSRDAYLAAVRENSLTAARPWEAEGVSRATWYRRRAAGDLTVANAPQARPALRASDRTPSGWEFKRRGASAPGEGPARASLCGGSSGQPFAGPTGERLRQGAIAPLLPRDNRVSPAESLGFGPLSIVDSVVAETALLDLPADSPAAWRYVAGRLDAWHRHEAALSVGEDPPPPLAELLSYARELLVRAAGLGP